MTRPGPDRLDLAVYVCADPGVPVFGTKGSSVHVRAVLAELARRTEEVHLITPRPGGRPEGELAGVHVHELPRPGGDAAGRELALVAQDAIIAELVGEIVGDRTPDVVYQRYSLWSCASMELAAERRWPSVLEINAPLVEEQARHRGLVDRPTAEARTARAIRAAGFPFAVTSSVATWAEQLADRPVAVVPNGVDPARFVAPDPTVPGARPLTIGFVGTFKPWHDVDTLIETVRRLAATDGLPPVRLLLVGDGPELPRVLQHCEALGLASMVEAVGAVAADEIPALLGEVDVAVAPYGPDEQYFSPLKVFEYLAAGTAVVASHIDGLDGLLADDEAVLVAPGDRDGFADAVLHLCTDPAGRAALGRAGQRAARTRFGWDRAVDHILRGVEERAA